MKENKYQQSTLKLDYRKIRDTLEYQLRISLLRNNDEIVAITDEFLEIAKDPDPPSNFKADVNVDNCQRIIT